MKAETMYRCEICNKLYKTEEEAFNCELRSVQPFDIGDHIALNGRKPADGMTGYIRAIKETHPHLYYVVLARTDSWNLNQDSGPCRCN